MLISAENWNEFLAEIAVAPFVGAWIETEIMFKEGHDKLVAPFVGAWIETLFIAAILTNMRCRSLRGSVD